jgi:hypothetical protein
MEKRVVLIQKAEFGCSASLENYPIKVIGHGDSPSAALYDMIFHNKEIFDVEIKFHK